MFRGYCIIEVCISFFFVLTSGRTLPGTTFFVLKFEATLQPLCSADRDSEIFCTAATALFIAVKGLSLQRETAIFCYCCSQPFCSSFVALLEVILQRCSSAARFVRGFLYWLWLFHSRNVWRCTAVCGTRRLADFLAMMRTGCSKIWGT